MPRFLHLGTPGRFLPVPEQGTAPPLQSHVSIDLAIAVRYSNVHFMTPLARPASLTITFSLGGVGSTFSTYRLCGARSILPCPFRFVLHFEKRPVCFPVHLEGNDSSQGRHLEHAGPCGVNRYCSHGMSSFASLLLHVLRGVVPCRLHSVAPGQQPTTILLVSLSTISSTFTYL